MKGGGGNRKSGNRKPKKGLEAGAFTYSATAARFPQGPGAEDESREPCQEDGILPSGSEEN